MSSRFSKDPGPLAKNLITGILCLMLTAFLLACESEDDLDVVPTVSLSYKPVSVNSLTMELSIVTNMPEITLSFGDGTHLVTKEKKVVHTYPDQRITMATARVRNSKGSAESQICIDTDPILDCN